jgi:hypothetical protein
MTAKHETKTESVPPVRQRTSDVFSYPPVASPFDQNSKLWESIMPGPKPALHAVVRRKVGALSDSLFRLPIAGQLSSLAARLPAAVPGWRRLGYASQWLILTAGGMALAFTLSWTLSRGSSPSAKSTKPSAELVVQSRTGLPDVAPEQAAHALKPAAPAVHAMPVAVSAPEPEAPGIAASAINHPNDGVAPPAEVEPRDVPVTKTRAAKNKKKQKQRHKQARAGTRTTKAKARTTRTVSR